ncbi:hypothetical protein C0992_001849 [Termitomyces sp. T32_za158]|nr:hypothetical protein C0992_001849 [Termitomyces sp. T32_za158]
MGIQRINLADDIGPMLRTNHLQRLSEDSGTVAFTIPISILETSSAPTTSDVHTLLAYTLVIHLPKLFHNLENETEVKKPSRDGVPRAPSSGAILMRISSTSGMRMDECGDIRASSLMESGAMPSVQRHMDVTRLGDCGYEYVQISETLSETAWDTLDLKEEWA